MNCLEENAKVIIDATKLVLCPGFIDVHSHDDYAVFCNPDVDYKILQGITTEIVGNCGLGAAPFRKNQNSFQIFHPKSLLPKCDNYTSYVRALNDFPFSVNLAFLVGHNTLRSYVMENIKHKLSIKEMNRMCELLNEGLSAGALGFSSGLIYEPGCYATEDELIILAKETTKSEGIYTTHLRNESDKLLEAVTEAISISTKAKISLQISHHKALERRNWGLVKQSLQLIEEARARGLDVTADQYPYTSSSTILSAALRDGRIERINADDILIASISNTSGANFIGKTLSQLCKEWELSSIETANRLLKSGETFVVINSMSEEDICTVMKHETTMIGSDGVPSDIGNPHPRLYGTFPRVLGHYVREKKLLTFEQAVYRMTGLPATKFKIKKRGFIKENYYADLVLMNPDKVQDTATYDDPRQYPLGIEYVFVNGSRIVMRGKHTNQHPGMIIHR